MAGRGAESAVDRARRHVGVFAEQLIGQPLWNHQLEAAMSPARWRIVCAGRQVGKSRMLAVIALHKAFSSPRSMTLIVSAGETASRRLLEEIATLALNAPMLAGSVIDESSKAVVLSNGSTIRSVPASQAQIRGWAVDLLILDEAAFIDPEIFRAAEPSVIARSGSRVILCSSPWGQVDHPFRMLWTLGMTAPSATYEAWHWPSSVSPLVSAELLEEIRQRSSPIYFEREYEARWLDDVGSYFTAAELDAATSGGVELVPPSEAVSVPAVGGVDWGLMHDASTLAVIAPAGELGGRPRYRVAWLEERFKMPYGDFIDLVVAAGADPGVGRGYAFRRVMSEANGVGQFPTAELQRRMGDAGRPGVVEAVYTTIRTKEDGYGFLKGLMQAGRLDLPRDPRLLKQLQSLEYEMTEGGGMKISVRESRGHDDVCMAVALSASALMADDVWGNGALGAPIEWRRAPLLPYREIDWMSEPM
jgi:Terminase large subunit, T4likevirus-type, N-terminal